MPATPSMTARLCRAILAGGVIVLAVGPHEAYAQAGRLGSWHNLSQEERGRAQRNYQDFQQLPEQGRRQVEERYRRWQTLEPERRQQVQRNYERYNNMSPEQRRRFKRGYDRWKVENAGRQ